MSFYDSETLIAIHSFRVYCDICQNGFRQPLGELNQFMIRRSAHSRTNSMGAEAFDTMPPITKELMNAELIASGWKFETIHGKDFIICRECAAK